MGVHTEMMAQGVAGDPFDHAFGEAAADHAGERDLERRIGCDMLDPGPEIEHSPGAGVGRKILHIRVRGIDDVVNIFGREIGFERIA